MLLCATHQDPKEAANYLLDRDSKRSRKLMVEASQILSEACRIVYNEGVAPSGYTGNAAPAIWAAQRLENMSWVYHYMLTLWEGIRDRTGTQYKVGSKNSFYGMTFKQAWESMIRYLHCDGKDTAWEKYGLALTAQLQCTDRESASIRARHPGMSVTLAYQNLLIKRWGQKPQKPVAPNFSNMTLAQFMRLRKDLRPEYINVLGEILQFKEDSIMFHGAHMEQPYSSEIVYHFLQGNKDVKIKLMKKETL